MIETDEEKRLKHNPDSLIHLILPDGEGEEVYQNAKKAFDELRERQAIKKGDMFNEENIMARRPGGGISPMLWHKIELRRAKIRVLPSARARILGILFRIRYGEYSETPD